MIVYLGCRLCALYDSDLELLYRQPSRLPLSAMLCLGNSQGTNEVYKRIASEWSNKRTGSVEPGVS